MNNIEKIGDLCFGCRSCEQSCPKHCITIQENDEGFLYPFIDLSACVECGLCLKKCPANDVDVHRNQPKHVYGARNKEDASIMKSASGGISDVAATYILNRNGIVFGAAYDDGLHVHHIEVKDIKDKYKIQSSKYVQSNLEHTYSKAKAYLDQDRFVLFTGTPCQISGLYAFLQKDYEKLYTLDLICHGVPSPKLFDSYIQYQSKKLKEPVTSFDFRSKEKRGWATQYKITTEHHTKSDLLALDKYGKHFMDGDCYRMSCYQCPFANLNRVGDLTIGDFWSVSQTHKEFYSDKGVSSVFVNTEKGQALFNEIKDDVYHIDSTVEKALMKQGNLVGPTKYTSARKDFYKNIGSSDFFENMKIGWNVRARIKRMLPKKFIQFIKNI